MVFCNSGKIVLKKICNVKLVSEYIEEGEPQHLVYVKRKQQL